MPTPNATNGLSIDNICIEYTLKGQKVHAVSDFTAHIQQGESVSIVGPSGCGKTSVLRSVAGLILPSSGRVSLKGREITGPGLEVGVVFQDGGLLPWLSVRQNIEFGLLHRIHNRDKRRDRVQTWIRKMGLDGFADAKPSELSGGMRQRVAIARTLAGNPSAVLMDEPFGALDAQTRTSMQELTAQLITDNEMTTLFVTHDIDESLIIGDRIIVMSARPGRLLEEITNPFPRPRSAEMFGEQEYAEMKSRILHRIRSSGVST